MLRIILTFALLASAITTNKLLLSPLPPIFFVGIRMFLAGIILWFIYCFQNKRISFKFVKQDIAVLILITLCTTYIPAICKSIALKYMPSSQAAFYGTFDPFITAVYTYFIFNEKLTIQNIIGMCIAISGSLILLSSVQTLDYANLLTISMPHLCALLAVAVGRYGWILIQMLLKNGHYTPIEINTITMLASGIFSLITSLIFESYTHISINNYVSFTALILYTVIIGNVISLTMYANLLKQYNATLISLAGFSVPIFVHLYGYLFLSEDLSFTFFIATITTFFGLLIFTSKQLINQ